MTATPNRTGFILKSSQISDNILIPKYYDPEISHDLNQLAKTHDLIMLDELTKSGDLQVDTGDEIGKMAYGTGNIPFVRTSDIVNWELKADPKQGVSNVIYKTYAAKQDVRVGDLFFVRDGTYLIGECCVIEHSYLPLLYQSHVLKFRVKEGGKLSVNLLLAVLSSPIVRRQIRAKQFTADIIDSIGNRYKELVLPIPKDPEVLRKIDIDVKGVRGERADLLTTLVKLPHLLQGSIKSVSDPMPIKGTSANPNEGNLGFVFNSSKIRSNVMLPRYYDPLIDHDLSKLAATHHLVTMDKLCKDGTITWNTGIEVGKMAYGTGPIPFIRTSDISNWEIKLNPKQRVSEKLYDETKARLNVQSQDIFIVRDGTYLVGVSCIITRNDIEIVFCGGLYKLRVEKKELLDPFLLLTILHSSIVERQIRAKQFTRDVIDTIGKRLFEIVLPIPKNEQFRDNIAETTRKIVERRADLRDKIKQISFEIQGLNVSQDG